MSWLTASILGEVLWHIWNRVLLIKIRSFVNIKRRNHKRSVIVYTNYNHITLLITDIYSIIIFVAAIVLWTCICTLILSIFTKHRSKTTYMLCMMVYILDPGTILWTFIYAYLMRDFRFIYICPLYFKTKIVEYQSIKTLFSISL